MYLQISITNTLLPFRFNTADQTFCYDYHSWFTQKPLLKWLSSKHQQENWETSHLVADKGNKRTEEKFRHPLETSQWQKKKNFFLIRQRHNTYTLTNFYSRERNFCNVCDKLIVVNISHREQDIVV